MVGWFSVGFFDGSTSVGGDGDGRAGGHGGGGGSGGGGGGVGDTPNDNVLSTAPGPVSQATHWGQTVFVFPDGCIEVGSAAVPAASLSSVADRASAQASAAAAGAAADTPGLLRSDPTELRPANTAALKEVCDEIRVRVRARMDAPHRPRDLKVSVAVSLWCRRGGGDDAAVAAAAANLPRADSDSTKRLRRDGGAGTTGGGDGN